MRRLPRTALVLLILGLAGCAAIRPGDSPARSRLLAAAGAARNGAADLRSTRLDDGGLVVDGTLAGHAYAIAFPVDWNGGDALLFAHGYTLPGASTKVPDNPLDQDLSGGLLKYAYLQGYAVATAAYDKAGLGVQSGVENSLRLMQYLDRLGAKRVYIAGGSMGGNIVVGLIEMHPDAFAGALAVCGADDSFAELIGRLIDIRAVYDYYTAGTPYALPGSHELNVSALAARPPTGLGWLQKPWAVIQLKRIFDPIKALFTAAAENPDGREAAIIRKVSAVTGWEPDPAAFVLPIATIALGMDDVVATAGGSTYDNRARVYRGAGLTDADIAALNRGIARIAADPQAVAYIAKWHTASGRFDTPLLTLHNRIDSLVPYAQPVDLGRRVAAAGNLQHLVQLTVPPMRRPLPFSTLDGYMHCGFRPQQLASAWDELRRWVERGEKPDSGSRP